MMTTTSASEAEPLILWASVCGKAHRALALPNQDSVLARRYDYGVVLALADGVGSQPFAKYGSRCAVQAVHEAFASYAAGGLPRKGITQSIVRRYREKLRPRHRGRADTTCLFAAQIYGEGLYLGQMGDGLLCALLPGKKPLSFQAEEDFCNILRPLSALDPLSPWKRAFIPERSLSGMRLLLATDGVAEDLLPGREGDFLDFLLQKYRGLAPRERERSLREQLENWLTPASFDDKTLLIYAPGR